MGQTKDVILHLKSGSASETLEQFVTLQERVSISGVILNDASGIAADGGSGNYRTISLDSADGSKQYYVWDTRTANNGALVAGTNTEMAVGSSTDDPVIEAGTAFKIRVAAGGSGQDVNCTASIKCMQFRKF